MLWGESHTKRYTTSDLPWWHSEKEAAWEWNVRPSIKKQTIEYFMFEGNCVFCHLYLGKGKQQKMQLYPVLKSQTWGGENFYALWFRTTCHISLSVLGHFFKLSQSLKMFLHDFLFYRSWRSFAWPVVPRPFTVLNTGSFWWSLSASWAQHSFVFTTYSSTHTSKEQMSIGPSW